MLPYFFHIEAVTMKIIIPLILSLIILAGIVSAADTVPIGNYQFNSRYGIFNVLNITGYEGQFTKLSLNGVPILTWPSSGGSYNQSLNTTDNVRFNQVTSGSLLGFISYSYVTGVNWGDLFNINTSLSSKLDATDQRYNESALIKAVNASIQVNTWNSTSDMQAAVAGNLTTLQNNINANSTSFAGGIGAVNSTNAGATNLNASLTAKIQANDSAQWGAINAVNASASNTWNSTTEMQTAVAGNLSTLQTNINGNSTMFAGNNLTVVGAINQNSTALVAREDAINLSALKNGTMAYHAFLNVSGAVWLGGNMTNFTVYGFMANFTQGIYAYGSYNITAAIAAVNATAVANVNTWNSSTEMQTAVAGNLSTLQNNINSNSTTFSTQIGQVNGSVGAVNASTRTQIDANSTTFSGYPAQISAVNTSHRTQIDSNSTTFAGWIGAVNATVAQAALDNTSQGTGLATALANNATKAGLSTATCSFGSVPQNVTLGTAGVTTQCMNVSSTSTGTSLPINASNVTNWPTETPDGNIFLTQVNGSTNTARTFRSNASSYPAANVTNPPWYNASQGDAVNATALKNGTTANFATLGINTTTPSDTLDVHGTMDVFYGTSTALSSTAPLYIFGSLSGYAESVFGNTGNATTGSVDLCLNTTRGDRFLCGGFDSDNNTDQNYSLTARNTGYWYTNGSGSDMVLEGGQNLILSNANGGSSLMLKNLGVNMSNDNFTLYRNLTIYGGWIYAQGIGDSIYKNHSSAINAVNSTAIKSGTVTWNSTTDMQTATAGNITATVNQIVNVNATIQPYSRTFTANQTFNVSISLPFNQSVCFLNQTGACGAGTAVKMVFNGTYLLITGT